jgi:hypothetical protein
MLHLYIKSPSTLYCPHIIYIQKQEILSSYNRFAPLIIVDLRYSSDPLESPEIILKQ